MRRSSFSFVPSRDAWERRATVAKIYKDVLFLLETRSLFLVKKQKKVKSRKFPEIKQGLERVFIDGFQMYRRSGNFRGKNNSRF